MTELIAQYTCLVLLLLLLLNLLHDSVFLKQEGSENAAQLRHGKSGNYLPLSDAICTSAATVCTSDGLVWLGNVAVCSGAQGNNLISSVTHALFITYTRQSLAAGTAGRSARLLLDVLNS